MLAGERNQRVSLITSARKPVSITMTVVDIKYFVINVRMLTMSNGAGKGDKYRSVDKKKYDANWEKIFRSFSFFCKFVVIGHDSCGRCKYNQSAVITSQILYCPKTGVEPDESN